VWDGSLPIVRLSEHGAIRIPRSALKLPAGAPPTDQALALGAADPHKSAATWQGTREGQEELRKERQEALERYRGMWGRDPADEDPRRI
jgi:hypothetical protein